MKKMLCLLCLLLFAGSAWAYWRDPKTGIEWMYEVWDGKEICITGCGDPYPTIFFGTPDIELLEIPSRIEGKPVTSIGAGAFYLRTALTGKVVIPPSVTIISRQAFYECWNMVSLSIPRGITYIGQEAFHGCTALTEVTFSEEDPAGPPETDPGDVVVTGLCRGAFSECPNLTSISIPKGVISLGEDAFRRCRKLTSVDIPPEIKSIGKQAFDRCTGLSKVTVSPNVMHIGERAFYQCRGVSVDPGNGLYSSDPSGVLFHKSGEYLIQAPRDIGAAGYVLPPQVRGIQPYAFHHCEQLTSVTLSPNLTSVGDNAFAGCTGLTAIRFPARLTTIGNRAFSDCTGLTSVTLSAKLTAVGDWAFCNCTGLTAATLSGNAANLGKNAFYNCTALTSLTINEGVAAIGDEAFRDCGNLTTVTVPASVIMIGLRAFANCNRATFAFAGPPPNVGTAAFSSKGTGTYPKAHAAAWRAVLKGDTGTWNRLAMSPASR